MRATENLLSVLLVLQKERRYSKGEIDQRERSLAMTGIELVWMSSGNEHIARELRVRYADRGENVGVPCDDNVVVIFARDRRADKQCDY
jgi:hypothetical protein